MREVTPTRYLLTWTDVSGVSQTQMITRMGWHRETPVKVYTTTITTPLLMERLDMVMREVDKQVVEARERLSIHIETSFSIAKAHSQFECAMANAHMAIREEFLLGWYTNSLYHRLSERFTSLDWYSEKMKNYEFSIDVAEYSVYNQ